jgi:O-antigen/teichoic acid export membrane protein
MTQLTVPEPDPPVAPSAPATSRRAVIAVVGTAIGSLASFGLTVAVARGTNLEGFSEFSLAGVVYVALSGCLRAAFAETTIVALGEPAVHHRQVRRTGLSAIVLSCALAAAAFASSNWYLLALALCIHGMALADYGRMVNLSVRNGLVGVAQSVSWAGPGLAVAAASLFVEIPPIAVFASWAIAGALTGYVTAFVERWPLRPGWNHFPQETRTSAIFTLDYAIGSGGSAFTTLLLGAVLGATAIGALRGASTLLGPVAIVATSARAVVLPSLVRSSAARPMGDLVSAARASLVLSALLGPGLAFVAFMPTRIGSQLLGDSFSAAVQVMPALAIETFFALIGGVAAAGHRSRRAGRRALSLRVSLGLPRPIVVCWCGAVYGITGAVWAMAGLSILSAIVWWISFTVLTARDR